MHHKSAFLFHYFCETQYLNNHTLVANDYGADATIAQVAGPWAVGAGIDAGQLLGNATLTSATFNYGGAENGTFLLEYILDKSLLEFDVDSVLTAKVAYGCGNDVIRVNTPMTHAPEPATFTLMAGAAGVMWVARRRRRGGR